MPKFLTAQAKEGLSTVAKTNMKNAAKLTVKKMAEELITYGLGKAEEELLKQILAAIENNVNKGIADDVKSNLEKGELGLLVDSIILSHVDEEQLQDLLRDKDRKTKLLNIFTELSKNAVQPFYADLSLQNKLNSSFHGVIDKALEELAEEEVKGKATGFLTSIKLVHMGALAAEATAAVLSLSSKFFQNLQEQLTTFKKDHLSEEKLKHQSPQDTEMLKEFKQELADTISNLMAAALVEVFHQKFSSHLVSWMQSKAHGVITQHVRSGLKTDRTEELLRAGQNNSYIKHMPVDQDLKRHPAKEASESLKTHAEKIKDANTPGNILDIRVLSETTGTKVVLLTENSQGKLTKMQQVHPNTNPASQEVTLIYRPKSVKYPDGHYDVLINNHTVSINSKDKSCLFHALARGMNPDASEVEISKKADDLRHSEADTLLKEPDKWEPFVKRKEWTDAIRGGDWYMAEGAMSNTEKETLRREVGKVELYSTWKQHAQNNPGLGQLINADHQPPVSCILNIEQSNQSELAKAMLKVATGSSNPDKNAIDEAKKYHGLKLPTVYVPAEIHRDFLSTTSPKFREFLIESIQQNDVVGTF
ncbi:uncharacterized protein LOC121521073 [Cheilinus undulatus]|uniref:uncharacterized protein LOC121521073 n=1 Tax=Cheilinus undulatus TaxID=241271 RepID=UPI001BD268B7|nr:uncharacterized protein LOC121521073 [Cheilinus undulatus]